ncbi:hypothetical protein JJB67_09635 [Clostridium perfringens]|uniref:hypothetical protein n=1 Tax=Clostridium perfringens TaxID=1502 RepID=UPI000D7105BE|nr:hypothetical protein [Clostridium perfringens]MBO3322835.1 hypothetical protein [Clostridium perfringens]MBO3331756.1 hypothetical protein [Clostridium perfringens]PWW99034.1 hypothetical protein CYK73_13980 [Clostridium perfringens]PWW99766.1 hypothetical protein CYK75_10110 [Clostridium perfringens]
MNSEQITLALIGLLFLLILNVLLVGIAIFDERIEFTNEATKKYRYYFKMNLKDRSEKVVKFYTDFKYMKLEDIMGSYLNEKLNSIVYCEEGNNIIVPLIEIDSYEISFEKNEKYRATSIKNYLNIMKNINLVYVFLLYIYLIWFISSKFNIAFYENFKDSIYVISRLSILIMIFITLIDIFIFSIKDGLIKAEKKEFMLMKKYKFYLNLKVIMIILNMIVSSYLK